MARIRISVTLVLLFTLGSMAQAGKLGSLRGRSAQSQPSRPASAKKSSAKEEKEKKPTRASRSSSKVKQVRSQSSSKSSPKPTPRRQPSPTPKPRPKPQPSSPPQSRFAPRRSRTTPASKHQGRSTTNKLASVRDAVRTPAPASPHRPNAGSSHRPSRPPRRPRPSGARFHAHAHFGSPAFCGPTIIEEHHYLPVQPVVETFVVDQPPPLPAPPPVMPPESEVVVLEPAPTGPASSELVSEVVQQVHVDPFSSPLDPYQVRFEIDYAGDEADVTRMGFGLLANATGSWGVDTGARLFREQGDDFRDHLWIGDFNLTYELFPTKYVRTRAGVGVNWLADRYGAEAGLNLTVGTELFAGPVTLTGEADFGTLGDSDLLHGRLSAALRTHDHVEWFAGYDYLDIGGVEIRGVLAGVRFRF